RASDFLGLARIGPVLSVARRIIEHMFRSYQYVLHPTARQGRALEHLLAVQCEAYNAAALEERREAFKRGIRVQRFDQFAQLKDLHEARPDFMRYGVTVARGTLTRLDRAFSAFYRRLAAGDKPGFPRFKARWRFDCASYEDTSGWKLKEGDRRLYLQGIGHVKLKLHRPLRVASRRPSTSGVREGASPPPSSAPTSRPIPCLPRAGRRASTSGSSTWRPAPRGRSSTTPGTWRGGRQHWWAPSRRSRSRSGARKRRRRAREA